MNSDIKVIICECGHDKHQKSKLVADHINSLGKSEQPLSNTWLVENEVLSASKIADQIKNLLDANDKVMVFGVSLSKLVVSSRRIPAESAKWISENVN